MSDAAQMRSWYQRAQIDYINKYMSLYASFNVWYRTKTKTHNDRQALNILRKGNEVWDDYCNGGAMTGLGHAMTLLVELTQREPISYASPHWKGEVLHIQDWPSLIEYWYRVRCLVMHGAEVRLVYVHLAYETLNIFMGEIIRRDNTNTVYNIGQTGYN